jgi:hypothetical protein
MIVFQYLNLLTLPTLDLAIIAKAKTRSAAPANKGEAAGRYVADLSGLL